MTKEEMRTAIAESEGWKLRDHEETVMHWPGGMLPKKVKRWFCNPFLPSEPPNYPEDLNAILRLLPVNIVIVKYERDWNVRGNDPAYHSARNQSLALAACEFYLKWKGLWKD